MFCKNCGSAIPEDANYCPECGTPVEEGDADSGEEEETTKDFREEAEARETAEEPDATSVAETRNYSYDDGYEEGEESFRDESPTNGYSVNEEQRTGTGSGGNGFVEILARAVTATSDFLLPLQRWIYERGNRGKWIVILVMVIISLLPMLFMPMNIFGGFAFLVAGAFTLFGILIQYVISKIPVKYAFKKIGLTVAQEKIKVNVLLLMAIGQLLSLATNHRQLEMTLEAGRPPSGGIGGIILSLLVTTFIALALFWRDFRDEEDLLPFSGWYILMRFIISLVISLIAALIIGLIIGLIVMGVKNSLY